MPAGWQGGWTLVMDTDDPEGHRGSTVHHEGDEVPLQPRSLLVLAHPIHAAREHTEASTRH